MAVFGKLAYGDGATVGTLLAVRFVLAAALFWALVLASGAAHEVRDLSGRDILVGLALGGCGYTLQAGCYFAALERIHASLLSLLLYTFPAIVAASAVALGRERLDGRRLTALGLAGAGLVLVVAGAGTGGLDPLGATLGLGAAVVYSAYILVSEGIAGRIPPSVLAALVCTGAAAPLTVGSALLGELRPGELTPAGWGWLACLASVSTVASISLFFAGLRRVGATTASILATVEPLVTVLLAFLVFGETLSVVQLAGGALVLAAVLVLHARFRRGLVPLTVRARLLHVSAGLHLAPAARAVLGAVVERPQAVVARARLEPLPGSLARRGGHDRHQVGYRAVDAHGIGHELGLAAGREADPHAGAAGRTLEPLDRGLVEGLAVVLEQQRPESLAHFDRSPQIALAYRLVGAHETALREPGAQSLGRLQLLVEVVVVDAVHEALDERQRLGCRLAGLLGRHGFGGECRSLPYGGYQQNVTRKAALMV